MLGDPLVVASEVLLVTLECTSFFEILQRTSIEVIL